MLCGLHKSLSLTFHMADFRLLFLPLLVKALLILMTKSLFSPHQTSPRKTDTWHQICNFCIKKKKEARKYGHTLLDTHTQTPGIWRRLFLISSWSQGWVKSKILCPINSVWEEKTQCARPCVSWSVHHQVMYSSSYTTDTLNWGDPQTFSILQLLCWHFHHGKRLMEEHRVLE